MKLPGVTFYHISTNRWQIAKWFSNKVVGLVGWFEQLASFVSHVCDILKLPPCCENLHFLGQKLPLVKSNTSVFSVSEI